MMTNFNAWPGLYDNVHGDEDWINEMRDQDTNDIMSLISEGGKHAYAWQKLLEKTDLFSELLHTICKDRTNPAYAKLVDLIKADIEGWL